MRREWITPTAVLYEKTATSAGHNFLDAETADCKPGS